MSAFQSGGKTVGTTAAKLVDIPGCPGGAGVVIQVRGGTGAYVGHDNTVDITKGVYVANGGTLPLPVTVPDGQTAEVWVKGATAGTIIGYFVGAAA